ncbi:flagellar biosynthetic protein FliP [Thermodesulfobium acidiphilum]|uniref:Flagellar biosynthetic protein FliP n=1 Tax=Thermodesulfobium acidiphilum TaxID=1794699 RepID=A0A2R4VY70_THEAF|nr:flagellar type III secretion system pore protein FliP [Thermodesulfobium acidiphilum]AWB09406.1 flagellar biosynthetic protein FliP [Thermodesulfobium acidiphilum]
MKKSLVFFFFIALLIIFNFNNVSNAAPNINIDLGAGSPNDIANSLKVLFVLTVLAFAPLLLLMTTSFLRLVIVFGFLRNALGIQQIIPGQILIGLSLFLTLFIMTPIIQKIEQDAYTPYQKGQITFQDAIEKGYIPLRDFMLHNTRKSDLSLMIELSQTPRPNSVNEIAPTIVISAFVLSELKTSFIIGIVIYLPFVIIDLAVASILMSMGMMMIPPVMISLPLKILLFVLADGWSLLVKSLIASFKI